jgi:tRNA threonylcarbamoyladenosine biosynthesis protein TsaB
VSGSRVLEEVALQAPGGFSPILFQEIERLLVRARIELSAIEGFAAAAGPGSFTGIRVGLAAVKGLAEATGRKAAGVSNLGALAALGSRDLRAVVINAQRGEVYAAVYSSRGEVVLPEVVVGLERWLPCVPPGAEFLTTDAAWLASQIPQAERITEHKVLAGAVGLLAQRALTDPALVDANYVRKADAELFWKE